MNRKKESLKVIKVEDPFVAYEASKIKFKGIDRATFEEEFKNGYTPEEFKAEMSKRIKEYPWK